MSASTTTVTTRRGAPPALARATPAQLGMLSFLVGEAAFFATLVMAYIVFLRQPQGPPAPGEVLKLPLALFGTLALISSSVTVHLAEKALHRESRFRFAGLWGLTIVLGVLFLGLTGREWHSLIYHDGLTIDRNLFGTTYFTLVGFHAAHVAVGVISMLVVLAIAARSPLARLASGVQLVSWYWHFVDAVWLVVFTVVYLVGR